MANQKNTSRNLGTTVCFVANLERFLSCYETEIGCHPEDLADFIHLLECFNRKHSAVLPLLTPVFKTVHEPKILIPTLFHFLSVVSALYRCRITFKVSYWLYNRLLPKSLGQFWRSILSNKSKSTFSEPISFIANIFSLTRGPLR